MYNTNNLAWKENLCALQDDFKSGELSEIEFFNAIIEQATPETAEESLKIIGKSVADLFDFWFVSKYGDHIKSRYVSAVPYSIDFEYKNRILEAFHRSILARREPL